MIDPTGFGRFDDQIRLAVLGGELPGSRVVPHFGLGHVFQVALRRAGSHPCEYGLDLLIGERTIVLEFLDTDRLVDVPRRHLTRAHALRDRAHPRTHFLVGP